MGVEVTPVGVTLPVGGRWVVDVLVTDDDGHLVDQAPVATVADPAGGTGSAAVDRVDVGTYRAAYTPTLTGRHVLAVLTADHGAEVAAVYVVGATTAAGMPNADDVAVYLKGDAASWSTEELADVLEVEAGAQRDRCRVPAAYPPALRGALLRRCHRNLAMRRIPLAMPSGDADGEPSGGVLPGKDPEVRRLEAPWRRLTLA